MSVSVFSVLSALTALTLGLRTAPQHPPRRYHQPTPGVEVGRAGEVAISTALIRPRKHVCGVCALPPASVDAG